MDKELGAHLPALKRYALGLTGQRAAADDLAHDCIARALASRNQWRGVNLKAWLYAIMTNLYRNRLRTQARRGTVVAFDEAVHGAPTSNDPDPLLTDRIREALDTLNPDMRAVLLLVVLEGCTYGEVAAILSVPEGTVMSRLSRSRHQLSRVLARDNIVSMEER